MKTINNSAQGSPWPCATLAKALGIDKAPCKPNDSKPRDADGARIPEGGRNTALTQVGGMMRRVGFDTPAIAAALHAVNSVSCNPALDIVEVDGIANSTARYTPSDPGAVLSTLTDTGNADRFAREWQERIRYVPEWKKWLVWVDNHWSLDEAGGVFELAKITARRINTEASAIADTDTQNLVSKHARQSQQLPRLTAMLELAKTIPSMVVRVADLDSDPMLLGVKNGTVDLRTGGLREAKQSDFITRQTPVTFDPGAKCATFQKFLGSVMAEDQDLVGYLQRILGYCLTGKTDEHCLFFLHGSGANGKSTLLNVVKDLLGGDLCKQAGSESLMVHSHGRNATNDVARLNGARVVLSNEVEEGSRLSEALIKVMTGGDPITARFLFAEFFEFVPRFKLLIAGNHQPVIRGSDDGIWRRLHLLPFSVTVPEKKRDHKLADKLRAELPGILNYAVQGCLEWQKKGLCAPNKITAAVAAYRSDMDIIGQWITENCVLRSDLQIQASDAYSDYKLWAKNNGFHDLSSSSFGRRLKERQTHTKNRNGTFYQGLSTKYQLTLEGATGHA